MKGTMVINIITFLVCPALIPVPMKGTIDIGWQVLHRYTILIPVPVKGTTSFITREIINDMF